MTYQLTVGLEVHVELKTKTKMFCGCANDPFNSKPNINVCPVCYGLPGALPLLNKEAVRLTFELGQALKGTIAETTFWARKNYFYPDLPKGYQISQSTSPLVEQARIEIDGVCHQIQRIHLEEDAGKSVHPNGLSGSLVNYNRAGVPLMEMVTEPDFHSAEDAKRFCQEIQRIVRALGISDADMEKGQMRCEANISVSVTEKLGEKVEVKNINSFRAVEKAIAYEYERQTELLDKGESVIHETRTWDSIASKTVSMRSKETSADYRYFPEPDLPIVEIEVGAVKSAQLPEDRRRALEAIGTPATIAQSLVDKQLDSRVLVINNREPEAAKEAAHLMLESTAFASLDLEDQIKLLSAKKSSGWTKDTLAGAMKEISNGKTAEEVIATYSEKFVLEPIIVEVITANQAAVNDYTSGKENALHFLVGQVMAKTKGKANINEVRTELQEYFKKS
ncbi:MAG: Asp-tRNA(Asn)/Glu-tRNA(Gln) amidotransferase subunit GatB [Candidatus Berkelbacteria bacterium]|nr:Asp-tRNA(Asn)/Glu-tRNA(Gln) amidotransferase subunit GatB [Candidatus Berkelbacteria bacterium]MCR4307739.1 Asp-tRNA(Asn)/Glu-tRNA(Gln) amidotransferase subunit GatB [Candidatus Berkelbacteria bacterium]